MRAAVLGLIGLSLCATASASVAFAQPGPPPGAPAKKPAKPAAPPPTQAPAATPAPVEAAPAEPAAPTAAPTTTPDQSPVLAQPAGDTQTAPPTSPPPSGPPPSYGPGQPPPAAPPAPYYERLGKPEPEIEKGDWDPWEHASPDQHNHDGFYLRLAVGFGGGSVWGNRHILPDVQDVTISGLGFGTSIAIGGAVTDNLILNADLFQATMFNPSVRQDGHHLGDASDLNRDLGVGEDVTVAGLGVGLTYYFMPVNVYIAGSVGFGQAVFENALGTRSGSDFGLATNLMVGKEWWVGSDWGIGVAGQFILLATHDDILGGLNGTVFNLMFSATYN